jgi:hypothetical protein
LRIEAVWIRIPYEHGELPPRRGKGLIPIARKTKSDRIWRR